MRTKICMAVVITCLAATGRAAAQYCELEKIEYRSVGDGVTADFSSVDASTCALGIETSVHVEASLGDIHLEDTCGSPPTSSTTVTDTVENVVAVVVSVYDRCLGMSVLSVLGSGEAEELHVSANRKTASLRAALTGTDASNQPVSVEIDLMWNGVGRLDHTGDHVTTNQGIFRLNFISSGTIRDAVAAGSVVVGGIDRTPLPSTLGTIEQDAVREFVVYR
jgi:hypothetical protein